jgi:hypothetical protein
MPGVQGGYREPSQLQGYVPGFWSGSSGTWTPLATASAANDGRVNALWGDTQGGQFNERAALWHGTPGSITYLQDAGSPYFGTSVDGMAQGEQVGNGYY